MEKTNELQKQINNIIEENKQLKKENEQLKKIRELAKDLSIELNKTTNKSLYDEIVNDVTKILETKAEISTKEIYAMYPGINKQYAKYKLSTFPELKTFKRQNRIYYTLKKRWI